MVEITHKSKYMDLLNEYPLLKTDLCKLNPKFNFFVTPMGKITLWNANLLEVSQHVNMGADEVVGIFKNLVDSY